MSPAVRNGYLILATLLLAGGAVAGMLWLLYKLPATVAALVAGAIGFLITKLHESWKESRQRLHDKKRDVYAKLLAPFLALHLEILKGDTGRPAHKTVRENMTTQWVEATFDAVLYASDDVLKLWGQIRTSALTSADPNAIMVRYMRLLKAMRRDVGNTYTAVSEADIMRLFVNFSDAELDAFIAAAADRK